jgi:hypothetical protein
MNPQPTQVLFELPFAAQHMYDIEADAGDASSFRPDELLEFPGVFNLDSWS